MNNTASHILRIHKLTISESRFPRNPVWTWEFRTLTLRICLTKTVWTSRFLVCGLTAHNAFEFFVFFADRPFSAGRHGVLSPRRLGRWGGASELGHCGDWRVDDEFEFRIELAGFLAIPMSTHRVKTRPRGVAGFDPPQRLAARRGASRDWPGLACPAS